jgi:hypothetical protein
VGEQKLEHKMPVPAAEARDADSWSAGGRFARWIRTRSRIHERRKFPLQPALGSLAGKPSTEAAG